MSSEQDGTPLNQSNTLPIPDELKTPAPTPNDGIDSVPVIPTSRPHKRQTLASIPVSEAKSGDNVEPHPSLPKGRPVNRSKTSADLEPEQQRNRSLSPKLPATRPAKKMSTKDLDILVDNDSQKLKETNIQRKQTGDISPETEPIVPSRPKHAITEVEPILAKEPVVPQRPKQTVSETEPTSIPERTIPRRPKTTSDSNTMDPDTNIEIETPHIPSRPSRESTTVVSEIERQIPIEEKAAQSELHNQIKEPYIPQRPKRENTSVISTEELEESVAEKVQEPVIPTRPKSPVKLNTPESGFQKLNKTVNESSGSTHQISENVNPMEGNLIIEQLKGKLTKMQKPASDVENTIEDKPTEDDLIISALKSKLTKHEKHEDTTKPENVGREKLETNESLDEQIAIDQLKNELVETEMPNMEENIEKNVSEKVEAANSTKENSTDEDLTPKLTEFQKAEVQNEMSIPENEEANLETDKISNESKSTIGDSIPDVPSRPSHRFTQSKNSELDNGLEIDVKKESQPKASASSEELEVKLEEKNKDDGVESPKAVKREELKDEPKVIEISKLEPKEEVVTESTLKAENVGEEIPTTTNRLEPKSDKSEVVKPKKKGPPPPPKKPSSKIAALHEMLKRKTLQEIDDTDEKPAINEISNEVAPDRKEASRSPVNKFTGAKAQFANNLNGLFALPGMTPQNLPPALSKKLAPASENAGTSIATQDESPKTDSTVTLTKRRAKGPRGRKLPTNVAQIEKVVVENNTNEIQVFSTWKVTWPRSKSEPTTIEPSNIEEATEQITIAKPLAVKNPPLEASIEDESLASTNIEKTSNSIDNSKQEPYAKSDLSEKIQEDEVEISKHNIEDEQFTIIDNQTMNPTAKKPILNEKFETANNNKTQVDDDQVAGEKDNVTNDLTSRLQKVISQAEEARDSLISEENLSVLDAVDSRDQQGIAERFESELEKTVEKQMEAEFMKSDQNLENLLNEMEDHL
ncbi:hypothetical protein TBLA_0J01880 [Henningerozyma blattae CBS 6284]|uniref:Altered inheritance of mitochondria protein 21 n=1 Tax=Henningerozyma blattae (strain ATCC 34711 / CBS 6284 / DSM 70876 / NBRC 10599 / NRRL Y-10934 / UCD 77-7) TaxID=1071380 RepID=I2H9Y2_HENB6|nr:hypothetical protein TBLA_0J01880 [Tetrapisispora blattae CBS 6284]CCH63184.1 hypothetical protein TBLA_0J01880 [Tetrapisispora blattae CBS 6284]